MAGDSWHHALLESQRLCTAWLVLVSLELSQVDGFYILTCCIGGKLWTLYRGLYPVAESYGSSVHPQIPRLESVFTPQLLN